MTWGFSLLGALLLLFPGFCAWLGLRSGSRIDYLSPVPEKPNSTYTLFVVLLGALLAHTLGASIFAVQEIFCGIGPCLNVGLDPDVYKAVLRHDQALAGSSAGIALSLAFFILLGAVTGAAFHRLARSALFAHLIRPELQGWVRSIGEGVADPTKAVTAFVLSKTGHDGRFAAYEGVVEQLSLDEDQVVAMIVLVGVDRFLVEIGDKAIRRLDVEGDVIPLVQLQKAEIANVAFDVIDLRPLHQPA